MRLKTGLRVLVGVVLLAGATMTLPLSSQAAKQPKAPKPASAITGGAVQVTGSSATLEGAINPHGVEASYYIQYGLSSTYGAQTPTAPTGAGTTTIKVSQAISGLQLGTTYHYRIVVVSGSGQTSVGQDRVFTTKKIPLKFEIAKPLGAATFGSLISVNGTLTGTGGANREVVLQANPFPYISAFTDVSTPVMTNSEGGFLFSLPSLSKNTKLRVATLDVPPMYSPVVTEHVAVRVTLRARATGHGGYVRLYGTVTPSVVGALVSFQLLKPGHSPSIQGGTALKRGTSQVSRFSGLLYVRHGRGGYYRALVKVSNGQFASGSSQAVLVHSAPAPARRK